MKYKKQEGGLFVALLAPMATLLIASVDFD